MTARRRPALYAILGSPVGHSVSPAIHAAGFRELGVEAAYGALEVGSEEVEAVMRALARQGGGNVTLPHKERAAAVVDRASDAVAATGACNCFWGEDGDLVGDNTDVEGFVEAVGALETESAAAAGSAMGEVLLLGAGGAARAVLRACLEEGAESIDVLNRDAKRAERMVGEVRSRSASPESRVRVLDGSGALRPGYDLVVNATSLGLTPDDPLPLELEGIDASAVMDLVYRAGETRWVRHARELEIPSMDGLEMLVRQAAASIQRWLGREAPLEVLRRAARESLEGP